MHWDTPGTQAVPISPQTHCPLLLQLSAYLPLQSCARAHVQAPFTHSLAITHTLAQPPQLFGSVRMFCSQPSVRLSALQSS